jgi:alpha-glucosidase
MRRSASFALLCIAASVISSAQATAQPPPKTDLPPVVAPTDSFFGLVRERDRDAARRFYKKSIDVKGMPVAASAEVADLALQRTYELVTRLLAGRPDVLASMVTNGMYLIVIGKDQVYTDMPEYRNHPNPQYQNERVRGTGGKPTSFGEENLLSLPLDRYDDESIGLHEFCHTIDSTLRALDPDWAERKNAVFRRATQKGLWKNTYAASNPGEFWAEICQSYFDCNRVNNWNHGPIGTREQLKIYDPDSYELVRDAFRLGPDQDYRYQWLQKLPNVGPPPAKFKIDPFYTRFTWAREFTVLGRQAGDEALLKANDTIRKMFAYRHDILKALIADGVKLVVLGRNERLSDLPELAGKTGIDLSARALDYRPETRLLVVGEESLTSQARGECLLIGEFARALYYVTGTRPADPNWNNRGRDVQQYELRVKRLDEEFGQRLKLLYQNAMTRGLWKGTAAARDQVEYWAQGVVAYFDGVPPSNDRPATTRETLKAYDPDLYQLVNETMAYEGHADWRYRRW